MRGDHFALVRHAELRQHLVGMPHGLPIGLAAHDHANERLVIGFRQCGLLALASEKPGLPSKVCSPSVFTKSKPASVARFSSAIT